MKITKIDVEKGNVVFTLENQQKIVTDISYGLAAMLKAYGKIELGDFLGFDIDISSFQSQQFQTPIPFQSQESSFNQGTIPLPGSENIIKEEVTEMEIDPIKLPDNPPTASEKKINPWFEHVKKVRKENPGLKRNELFALAKSTYKK